MLKRQLIHVGVEAKNQFSSQWFLTKNDYAGMHCRKYAWEESYEEAKKKYLGN